MKDYSEMIDIFIKLRNFTLELRAYSIKHNIPMLELFNDVEVHGIVFSVADNIKKLKENKTHQYIISPNGELVTHVTIKIKEYSKDFILKEIKNLDNFLNKENVKNIIINIIKQEKKRAKDTEIKYSEMSPFELNDKYDIDQIEIEIERSEENVTDAIETNILESRSKPIAISSKIPDFKRRNNFRRPTKKEEIEIERSEVRYKREGSLHSEAVIRKFADGYIAKEIRTKKGVSTQRSVVLTNQEEILVQKTTRHSLGKATKNIKASLSSAKLNSNSLNKTYKNIKERE